MSGRSADGRGRLIADFSSYFVLAIYSARRHRFTLRYDRMSVESTRGSQFFNNEQKAHAWTAAYLYSHDEHSVVASCAAYIRLTVFVRVPSKGEPRPISKMYGTAWWTARERAADKWAERHGEPAAEGFRKIRVHDLKHTFGRRLRAAGVSFEDRQDLLGHKSGRITTHYSQA